MLLFSRAVNKVYEREMSALAAYVNDKAPSSSVPDWCQSRYQISSHLVSDTTGLDVSYRCIEIRAATNVHGIQ